MNRPPAISAIEDLRQLARGHLGLIVGPAVTLAEPLDLQTASARLAEKLHVDPDPDYLEVGERAVGAGHDLDFVRSTLGAEFDRLKAAAGLTALAKCAWTAVLSIAPDDCFEKRLELEHNARPARRDIIVLTRPENIPRSPSVPVYKLLGSYAYGDLVVTHAEYMRRRAQWQRTILSFLDQVRSSPILVLGVGDSASVVDDVFSHLYGHRGQKPGRLVFVEGDPILESRRLYQLVGKDNLAIGRGSVKDVINAISPSTTNQQMSFSYRTDTKDGKKGDLSEFTDIVVSVTHSLQPRIKADERERLLDYLFMPDVPEFDPQLHGLDLERTIAAEITAELARFRRELVCDGVFRLRGATASGKTMILKRVAVDVAKQGALVCWLRDVPDAIERLEEMFKHISRHLGSEPLVLVIDIPYAERSVQPAALVNLAQRTKVRLLALYSARTSESSPNSFPISGTAGHAWDLDEDLDELEWTRLIDYQVALGIQVTREDAQAALDALAQERNAKDTLSSLFMLLPQTRGPIQSSVKGEYLALGNNEGHRRAVKQLYETSPDDVRKAYALVAVSENNGVPVPVEILVRALEMSYSEWLSQVNRGEGATFGLLYNDNASDPDSSTYRTRNQVITSTIVHAVNGGSLTREAELSLLRSLLDACEDGSGPTYSRYCRRLLTPSDKLRAFSYQDGIALFDAAIRALPYPHRSLLHHKAIWQRKRGNDPTASMATLQLALAADLMLPHGERTDPEEHIRTSIAAAILDQAKAGQLQRGDAQARALKELEKARSVSFLNPNAVHLYALTIASMIKENGATGGDRAIAASQALAEVDRTILLFRASRLLRLVPGYSSRPLLDVRSKLLQSWGDVGSIDEQAEDLWKRFKIQEGFVLAVRKRFGDAVLADRGSGSDYRAVFDYWQQVVNTIGGLAELKPELAEAGASIYYNWQVRPRSRGRPKGTVRIQWDLLRDTARIALGSDRYKEDLFYTYLYALSLAHLGEWADASAAFAANRRRTDWREMIQVPHDYLLDENGIPRSVQGTVHQSARGFTIRVPALGRDFFTDRVDGWTAGSEPSRTFIAFSLAGPVATKREDATGVDVSTNVLERR